MCGQRTIGCVLLLCLPAGMLPGGCAAQAGQPAPGGPAPTAAKRVSPTRYVGAAEAAAIIAKARKRSDFVIADGRTADEYRREHLAGAVNIDCLQTAEALRADLDKLHRNKTYLFHCATGSRCERAGKIMRTMGFREVILVVGGIADLKAQGVPTEK